MEGGSEVTEVSLEQQASSQERKLDGRSWQEIRDFYAKSSYPEVMAAGIAKIKEWEATPRTPVSEQEWNQATDVQIAKARRLRTDYPLQDAAFVKGNEKVVARGRDLPETGKGVLTRLYIGVDPRKATDAYIALLEQLTKEEVLKDIDTALNLDVVESRQLAGNTMIIYEPLSRGDVLDKILTAYRTAKTLHPEYFDLSSRQKAGLASANLRTFKAVIDANAAFVEIAPEDVGTSYDSGLIDQTREVLGIHEGATAAHITLEDLNERLKRRRNQVVLTKQDKLRKETGQVKPGEVLNYKRKLSAPALIQTGTVVMAKQAA